MQKLTDAEFETAWERAGHSPQQMADLTGLTIRSIYNRRKSLADRGVFLKTVPARVTFTGNNGAGSNYGWQTEMSPYRQRVDYTVTDGHAVFFGDCHWWPGEMSLANKALLIVLERLKPKFVAANGDLFDGARISRHEPLGWTKLPTVIEELDVVKQRLWEIDKRLTLHTERFYSPGNHCTRFDRRLATEVSEFEGVPGMRLEDHLKGWPMAYVAVINKDAPVPVVVCHNYKGGVHATWNNAIHSGASIVTGHLHSQDMKAHTDYFHTKYGVDHGMLADPKHAAFSYTMGRPTNWRSGFAVMKFDKEGRHFPPELCTVQNYDGLKRAVFRGEIIAEE